MADQPPRPLGDRARPAPVAQALGTSASTLLAAIIESSDDAIVSKSLEGVITSWNAGAERIFGYSAQEAVGQSITIIIPLDRLGEEEQILAKIKRGERIDHFETIRRAKSGREFPISVTISPVRDSEGRIVGASKVARDISEKKAAEAALIAERERLSLALAAGKMCVWEREPQSNQTSWSPEMMDLYGVPADYTGSLDAWAWDHVHPDDAAPLRRALEAGLRSGGDTEF
jgi:PAS domain S-box-containing protein